MGRDSPGTAAHWECGPLGGLCRLGKRDPRGLGRAPAVSTGILLQAPAHSWHPQLAALPPKHVVSRPWSPLGALEGFLSRQLGFLS